MNLCDPLSCRSIHFKFIDLHHNGLTMLDMYVSVAQVRNLITYTYKMWYLCMQAIYPQQTVDKCSTYLAAANRICDNLLVLGKKCYLNIFVNYCTSFLPYNGCMDEKYYQNHKISYCLPQNWLYVKMVLTVGCVSQDVICK